jgi:hypothetical protein
VTQRARICFKFWLAYAADPTPGRRNSVGMQPPPLQIDLNQTEDALAADVVLAAYELRHAEARFMDWVGANYPQHDLGHWDAHLGDEDGPIVSRFWSGFLRF